MCLDNRIRKGRDGSSYWQKWAKARESTGFTSGYNFFDDDACRPSKPEFHFWKKSQFPTTLAESHVLACQQDLVALGMNTSLLTLGYLKPSDITGSGEPTDLRGPVQAN